MKTARQNGGLATKERYGADNFYSKIGKLGGRPPLKSISVLLSEKQQQASGVPDNVKGAWPPTALGELRRLFFSRQRSNPDFQQAMGERRDLTGISLASPRRSGDDH